MSKCDGVLKNGIFNTIIRDTSRTLSEQYVEWLKVVSFGELKSASANGLKVAFPIEGVPIEFKADFTQDDFKKWHEAIDQGRVRNLTVAESQHLVEMSADKGVVDAWLECIRLSAFGLLDYETIGSDGRFSVLFRYSPNNVGDAEPKIVEPLVVSGARAVNPPAVGDKVSFGGFTVIFERIKDASGYPEANYVLNTEKGSAAGTIPRIILTAQTPKLKGVRLFHAQSGLASWPSMDIVVPPTCKMIGGGALINWRGHGNLLTGSYPAATDRWRATGKDHEISSPASIDVWAIAIIDPDDEWETVVETADSDRRSHPERSISVKTGYVMVGGGAKANWNVSGQLLTESAPVGRDSWKGASKDHHQSEPSTVAVSVVGIRPKNGSKNIEIRVREIVTSVAQHPEGRCPAPDGCRLIGGGARSNWAGDGNLLTASFPDGNDWVAKAKDHGTADPASITVFALGIPEEFFV
jgi:hypothetical protein